jgi:hypothetical protein
MESAAAGFLRPIERMQHVYEPFKEPIERFDVRPGSQISQ